MNINLKTILVIALFLIGFSSCNAVKEDAPVDQEENNEEGNKDVHVYLTTADRQHEFVKSYVDLKEGSSMSPKTISLDEDEKFQKMDGFGAALTGSTCFNLMQMQESDRKEFLTKTFSKDKGMGQSYVRISIGCSDFSLSEYTLADEPVIENFALQEGESKYVIPILKEVLAINPDVKIMGSPWTAPRWMKVDNLENKNPYNSWTGGHLNPAYYQDYATYFVKWIKAMDENGVPIYSITPQNEPLNDKNSASMVMTWQEQTNFIKEALRPELESNGIETKIYVFDHNYNYDNMNDQMQYPLKIYEDKEAEKYVAGAAYHNYGGDKAELIHVHEQAPDKELVFTETSIGTWNDGHNLEKRLIEDMEEIGLGTLNNWSKGVIVWNLMLDENRGPNREKGCKTCYGAVDIGNDYKTLQKNSHYFVTGHLSSVIQPDAVRIGATGFTNPDIIYTAFKNPDDSYSIVLLNKGGETHRINVSNKEKYFAYDLPSKSVASFKWK